MSDKNKSAKLSEIGELIASGTRKKCPCGSEYFKTVTTMVEVSALRTPSGKNETLLVGVLVCDKCGEEDKPKLIQSP